MEYYNMLIDKGASVGEVVTLKLTSGEELIGKLVEETDAHYKLSRPMVIAMGAQGPGLMPYLFTVSPDKDIKLSKSTVTVVAVTDKMFADQFIQSTTGIKLV
jgi:small nuclear ribonucleoprotein (snRNP)-like protein